MIDSNFTINYYQIIIALGTTIIAISNVFYAFYLMKFYKKATGLIKNIERNTRVVKTDILLKRRQAAVSHAEGRRIRASIREEEEMKG